MALSSPGVGSGLDVNNIVSQLMNIERRPLAQLDTREAAFQAQLSAYGNLRSALATFQSAVSALDSLDKFTASSAAASDTAVLSAWASKGVAPGSYAVSIAQLAQAQSLVAGGQASATASIGGGTATTVRIDFGTIGGGALANGTYTSAAFTQDASQAGGTVTITGANNSLQGIRDAINTANLGVTASIVKDGSTTPYRLVLQSAASGLSRSMRISVTGDAALQGLLDYDPAGAQNLSQTAAAQDAQLTLNGVLITSASNTVADGVEGVSLTLLKPGSSKVTIGRDTAVAKAGIEAFVKAYNDLERTLRDLAKFDPQTNQTGPLIGDTTLRTIQSQLRSTLSAALGGLGGSRLKTLGQAGIALQRDGTLAIDSAELSAALNGNADEVAALFTTVGRASDSLIGYSGSTGATRPGSYAVEISALATRGTLIGSVAAGLTVTAGINDQLAITVDGVSVTVTLAPGTYTATSLAAQVQAALAAQGAGVLVTESGGMLTFTSKRYGSSSTLAVGGNAAVGLLGGAAVATNGSDVAGSINGSAAIGSGQALTGARGMQAEGLALEVNDGALGARGRVDFARGYAYKLDSLLNALLSSGGPLRGRTEGINRSIEDLDDRRTDLNRRLEQIEQRYRAQFSALDTLVSNLQSTSNFLSQQLARLPTSSSTES